MAQDTVLSHISSEFKLWGVKFQHRHTEGGHIELAWQVSPDKPPRLTYIPKTGSDHRGWLNQRAQVRRMFKADGVASPKDPVKPVPAFQRALAMPKEPPEPQQDQLKAVRAEIGDLTEMVLELAAVVSGFADMIKGIPFFAQAPQPAEPPMPTPMPPPPPMQISLLPAGRQRAPNTRGQKAISYLSYPNWVSIDAIVRDMRLSKSQVKAKLVYLASQGKVEMDGDLWRRTPEKTKAAKKLAPVGLVAASKRKRNGQHLNGH